MSASESRILLSNNDACIVYMVMLYTHVRLQVHIHAYVCIYISARSYSHLVYMHTVIHLSCTNLYRRVYMYRNMTNMCRMRRHIYVQTRRHTYVYVYICMRIYICADMSMCIPTVCVYEYMLYTYIPTHVRIRICIYIPICMPIHVHICIFMYTNRHVYPLM